MGACDRIWIEYYEMVKEYSNFDENVRIIVDILLDGRMLFDYRAHPESY